MDDSLLCYCRQILLCCCISFSWSVFMEIDVIISEEYLEENIILSVILSVGYKINYKLTFECFRLFSFVHSIRLKDYKILKCPFSECLCLNIYFVFSLVGKLLRYM